MRENFGSDQTRNQSFIDYFGLLVDYFGLLVNYSRLDLDQKISLNT